MNVRVIRPLPESVINQIAAGEVIERPASIVKELVENALDAGAGSIEVELDDGGIARVQIRDDGEGIAHAQLPLALTRHCTSKITSADDLPMLVTLGFRGEALAAIASVADTTIISRTADAAHGWRIAQRASALPGAAEPAPHPRGTTVIVRDLFAQVPARRRFLKRAQTEGLHVLNLLRRIAFCTPAVAFTVTLDGQRSLQLPAASDDQSAERRRRALFGAEFSGSARYVDIDRDGVRVAGWVAGPALAHSQADLQMLAVNGRVIRDRRLAHAARTAFDDRLPAGRFPCFALHLEMAPDAVDVNVHPGKIEVRFRDLRTVHDVLHTAVREALEPSAPVPTRAYLPPAPVCRPAREAEVRDDRPLQPAPSAQRTVAAHGALPAVLRLVGLRYALVADDAGVALIDLGGLVEATLRVRLAPNGPVRPLMIPIRIECGEEAAALACAQTLRAAGLELNTLGPRTLALRALPVALPAVDPLRFGPALGAGDAAPAEVLLARAAARSLQPPPAAEQARWLAHLLDLARAAGVESARYERRLDEAALGRLFGPANGPTT